ncbi:MFS general substrate transporter [Crucibulum laeve]|uniref:MFS general substrate transporter n=1 Tax=Crucibulum laeve TaxID=68775 RepID=A0A5C3LKM0_9AGAR|nr:MFS general substrate transporter [Crucibulum laeve]
MFLTHSVDRSSSRSLDKEVVHPEKAPLESRESLEKRLVRKIDIRMSMLVVIFILNFIDRSNAAVARLRGFEEDLGLTGAQYPTVLSIFFVGYILVMVPSNMFLNHIGRPSVYLPACTILWGVVSLLTGQQYLIFTGALLCRFFLGLIESSFLPGALLTLSAWYKSDELGLRNCLLFCGLLVSTAFGTLMASGILDGMEGKLGQAAWRWLFYIEGSATIVIAIPAMFILPDFPNHPSSAKWLTPEELELAKARMTEENESTKNTQVTKREGLMMALRDWKVWWLCLCTTGYQLSICYNQFLPTLLQTLGYSRLTTLILCAPPAFVSAVFTFYVARHSDKTKSRFAHIAASLFLSILGFMISMVTMNQGARYFAIFLMFLTMGGWVTLLAWVTNSISSPSPKRAVALGLTCACSQLGSLAGSYVFPKQWGPTYRNSYGISIAAATLTMIMCFIFRLHLAELNRKANQHGKDTFKYIV